MTDWLDRQQVAVPLKTVAELIRKQSLVPFVGAGMSAQAGLPTWRDLIISLLKEYGLESELETYMRGRDYELAADHLLKAYGKEPLDSALRSALHDAPFSIEDGSCLDRIPTLFPSVPILTTNFDNLLRDAYRRHQRDLRSIEPGGNPGEIIEALCYGQSRLVLLHGSLQGASRVLTTREYDKHYRSGRNLDWKKPLPHALAYLFRCNRVIFLGCSLINDMYVRLLAELGDPGEDPRHFAVLVGGEDLQSTSQRAEELRALGIRPIWYPEDDRHTGFVQVLHRLHELVSCERQREVRLEVGEECDLIEFLRDETSHGEAVREPQQEVGDAPARLDLKMGSAGDLEIHAKPSLVDPRNRLQKASRVDAGSHVTWEYCHPSLGYIHVSLGTLKVHLWRRGDEESHLTVTVQSKTCASASER